jgi:hypothetical protein
MHQAVRLSRGEGVDFHFQSKFQHFLICFFGSRLAVLCGLSPLRALTELANRREAAALLHIFLQSNHHHRPIAITQSCVHSLFITHYII